jgi:PAS domain S-box-containing protein
MNCAVPSMDFRGGTLFHNTFVRYLFAIALVASTFALKLWLTPLTGTGAPFVLFFAAVLVISVAAGIGPGISAIVLSVPLEAYMFATRAGYPSFQVAGQGLLFAVDGLIAVYLTFLMKKERQAARDASQQAQDANRQLREANEQITSSMTKTREVIELSPDAFFQANLDGRFTDVNQAACRLLGYDRDELLGNTIFEMIPVEDRSRLKAVRAELLVPGHVHRAEWSLKRKDGTFVPVEVSAHILPDSRWQAFVRDISERKRIEQELKAANASLDAIIENIPLVLFLKDAKSLRYLRLNRAGEDLLGWPKETFIGKNDYQLWPQTQAELFVEKDREALKDKMIDIAEEPIQTHYQGVRLLHTKKVPILDSAGQPMYLLGISEDITERRRIEKEQQFLAEVNVTLSASIDYERTLATLVRLLVQDIADWSAIDVMDERGQLTRVKVACADAAKAALCADIEQLPPDRDLPHLMRSVVESRRPIVVEQVTAQYVASLAQGPGHLQALLATGVTSFVAVPLLLRGEALGAMFLGSSTLSRVFGPGDLRLAEALADRAAMAIENARLYRASVRAAQLQQVLSEAGAVLASSLDYEQTLATVAHLVVRDFADWCLVEVIDEREQIRRKIVAADPSKADLCALLEHMTIDRDRPHLLRPLFDTKQSLLIEHVTSEHLESAAQGPEHLQALRAVNPTSLMAVPLLRQGRLLGVLAFVSSTESRRYGWSDLPLAEALAERAAIAIENARLYRASAHATQLRDQVLGVVAHDLRNPLSAIRMRASLFKRHGPEPERRSQKPVEAIELAVRHMNRLIQDLLDIALMEAGQLAIERARLSASGLMVEAVDMQRSLSSSSSLELRIEADSNVPEIWGDRDRLLQVFENLIGNAIKFTKPGGCITVGAASRDHEVIFRVVDTGSGIAPENLPRVFDRFWQATRANRQGAGLGLPITKGIVEAHGGRIWVESTPNRGTTFFFTIPEAIPEQGRPSGPSGSSHLEGYRAA